MTDKLLECKKRYEKALLKMPNVVGIGIGRKVVKGRETKETCIVVFVTKKIPEVHMRKEDVIPLELEGVKTDVIETGVIKSLAARRKAVNRRGQIRPAPGGVSIGHTAITAGTLGMLVRKKDSVFILSNNHVLANSNNAQLGDDILQPGPADGGTAKDKIAALHEFVPISFTGAECPVAATVYRFIDALHKPFGKQYHGFHVSNMINRVDAALAKPLHDDDVTEEILEIGVPRGMAEALLDTPVKKSGRTTGLTKDKIRQINATVRVQYGLGREALFENQLIAGPMSEGGDSGSAVLDGKNRVVGILFAGSDQVTIINRIQDIVDELKISI